MRYGQVLLRLVLLSFALFTCGAWTHGSAACPQGNSLPDGCAGAPAVAAQYPNDLLTQVVVHVAAVGGTGYTNGTGYAWTSSGGGCSANAIGTVDVSGGALTNPVISTRGSGCTSIPTISVPAGAGAGSGGSLTATVFQSRPTWNVAGVDYGVGPSSAKQATFKDPNTAGWPACGSQPICLDTTTTPGITYVRLNSGGQTIDDYDFTKNSCAWRLDIFDTNWTVTNNQWCVQSSSGQVPVLVESTAGGGTFSNNIIDCNGVNFSIAGNGCFKIGTISAADTITVTYNWIKNPPVQAVGTSGGIWVEKWNLYDRPSGISGGATHADIQLPAPSAVMGDVSSAYEYWRQEDMGGNTGGRGYAWDNEGSGASITNSILFDHVVANFMPNAAVNEVFEFSQQDTVVSITLQNTYFNPQGLRTSTSSGAATGHLYCNDTGTGGHSATLTNPNNNIDMTTGTSHATFNPC